MSHTISLTEVNGFFFRIITNSMNHDSDIYNHTQLASVYPILFYCADNLQIVQYHARILDVYCTVVLLTMIFLLRTADCIVFIAT